MQEEESSLLIGREEERAELLGAAASRQSAFVVVYGRRRVGKTFLVRQTFGGSFAFQCSGLAKEGRARQLENFRDALREAGARDVPALADWFAAFNALRDHLKGLPAGKKTVFLDEMPWMDTPKSHFVSALEHFWNGWASARRDIVLVVCGSATSWLVRKVFRDRGGLHDRVTHSIRLLPFTLRECAAFAKDAGLGWTRRQILQCYMAFGGVPYYWSLLRRGRSVAQNIEALCFSERGALRTEFDRLFSSLFGTDGAHRRIVEALAEARRGLLRSELLDRLGEGGGGTLSSRLDDLESCGFVRRYRDFGKRAKESRYQLVDEFSLFHIRFVRASDPTASGAWLDGVGSQARAAWEGLAFELACLRHVDQIRKALGIAGVLAGVCSWSFRGSDGRTGAQVDLLLDRKDGIVNLCEMKFSDGPYSIDKKEEEAVLRRLSVFRRETGTRKGVHVTFVTPDGLARNSHRDVAQSEVTGDDLFA